MAVDDLICGIDKALRTLFVAASTLRSVPGAGEAEADLSLEEKASAGALMRASIMSVKFARKRSIRFPQIPARAANDQYINHLIEMQEIILRLTSDCLVYCV